ncbi:hypothetical protein G6F23_010077 [Rhizopus arrhizus]|nr:hypothetical protein G6F23_010077 [Rhizopus arrhizus]
MKKRQKNAHPRIADAIITSVSIPVLPAEVRNTFVRPDTIRLYVPDEQKEESDEERSEEIKANKMRTKYHKKRIKKVTKKVRNSIGKIRFTIIWGNGNDEEETVPSECLQGHPDWYMIEEFEHKTAQRFENSPAGQVEVMDLG